MSNRNLVRRAVGKDGGGGNIDETIDALAMYMHSEHMIDSEIDPTEELLMLHNHQNDILNKYGDNGLRTAEEASKIMDEIGQHSSMRKMWSDMSQKDDYSYKSISSTDLETNARRRIDSAETARMRSRDAIHDYQADAFRSETGQGSSRDEDYYVSRMEGNVRTHVSSSKSRLQTEIETTPTSTPTSTPTPSDTINNSNDTNNERILAIRARIAKTRTNK